MKLKPLHDRVVVKPQEPEEKVGSIIVPDAAKEKQVRGEVVAAGPGKVLDNGEIHPMAVGVGDVVVYGKYQGNEVKVEGEEYVILREEDVLGVITP